MKSRPAAFPKCYMDDLRESVPISATPLTMKYPTLFLPILMLLSPSDGSGSSVANSLQPFVDDHVVAGAVTLAATRDRVLDVGAIGFADLGARRPMETDAVFWIASMSKPITATAVMMLVDEGRISLDDPVSKYLPKFAGQRVVVEMAADQETLRTPAHPITIRNLLSHTSGLTARTPLEDRIDMLSLAQNVMSYPMLPLRFEPGSKYEYSNAGINTAGRIVELVSGMPFAEFLQRRLFDSLGMKDTTFWPDSGQLARLAKSYRAAGAGLEEIPIDQLSYPLSDRGRGASPAGGLFSTAQDLAQFCRMILGGGLLGGRRYVSESSVATMTATQTGDLPTSGGAEFGYGFGWQTFRKAQGGATAGSFQHGGAYNTLMRIDPARGLIGILLVSNSHLPDETQAGMRRAFSTAVNALGGHAPGRTEGAH